MGTYTQRAIPGSDSKADSRERRLDTAMLADQLMIQAPASVWPGVRRAGRQGRAAALTPGQRRREAPP